jgi:tetratricopeptide (TPR) repeat protein
MKLFDQSIFHLEETLRLRKAKLSLDHPDTLTTQAGLGVTYRDAGRVGDAIPLLEEVHKKGLKNPGLAWVGNALLTAYVQAGKAKEATALVTEKVQAARKQFPADSPQLAAVLTDVGKAFLDAKAYAAAEPLLSESLSLREQKGIDDWNTHQARSQLGDALLGQKKYEAAEPLLLRAYAGMKEHRAKIPKDAASRLAATLERLVRLYEAWEGKPEEAAKWRKELEAQTKPAGKAVKPKDK